MLPLLASCHFLEVEKTGKTSIKNFYSDIYALEAAVSGTYGLTYKFYDSYMVLYPEVQAILYVSSQEHPNGDSSSTLFRTKVRRLRRLDTSGRTAMRLSPMPMR